MKYRKEMRYKSSVDVSAKRSHALTKRKSGGVVVPVAKKAVMSPVSRQVSNMSNGNDIINSIGIGTNYLDGVVNMGLPQITNLMPSNTTYPSNATYNMSNGYDNINIGIGTNYPDVVNMTMGLPRIAHIVMPSSPATTFPSVIEHQNSFFFDSGNRAPSPMALPQHPTTLDNNNNNMAVAEEAQDTIFSFVSQDESEDNAVEHLPSIQVKQNIFDEVDKEFYGENDNDSVEGSLGVVSNSASSSGSSLQDVQSDIEDCLEVMAEILETSR